jgi:hypothetical protein
MTAVCHDSRHNAPHLGIIDIMPSISHVCVAFPLACERGCIIWQRNTPDTCFMPCLCHSLTRTACHCERLTACKMSPAVVARTADTCPMFWRLCCASGTCICWRHVGCMTCLLIIIIINPADYDMPAYCCICTPCSTPWSPRPCILNPRPHQHSTAVLISG